MAIFNHYSRFPSPSQAARTGTFWLYAKIDLRKWYTEQESSTAMADGDDFRIFKVRDKWAIRDSYIRIPTASDASLTYDIGTTQGGTEIANAIDGTDTSTYADWSQMTLDPVGNVSALTADGYIWLEANGATPTKGTIEILIEMFAGADDNEL